MNVSNVQLRSSGGSSSSAGRGGPSAAGGGPDLAGGGGTSAAFGKAARTTISILSTPGPCSFQSSSKRGPYWLTTQLRMNSVGAVSRTTPPAQSSSASGFSQAL